jgi:transposase
LGEGILHRNLNDWFGAENVVYNGEVGEGADFTVTIPTFSASFEAKFWIDTGNWPLTHKRSKKLILGKFSRKAFLGRRRFVIVLGRKPTNWVEISKWCAWNRIQPFYIPVNDENLRAIAGKAASPNFDVDLCVEVLSQVLKSRLFLVFSLLTEFKELSDEEWETIQSRLRADREGCRPRVSARGIINGILYRYKAGLRFSDIPIEYGSFKTMSRRYREWTANGTWDKILGALAESRGKPLLR